jgi:ubiquinone/menaquinone biosynthesis C-methylase UbiE
MKFGISGLGTRSTEERIDVKRLIAELSDADLLASADAYFAGLNVGSEQCHKPFSNTADAPQLAHNLGLLLEAAELFHGADVLDFGCATGWLALGLARMGCNAIGVDIAPAALGLAELLKAQRGVPGRSAVTFLAYDGQRLPLENESVDRIVSFDAFHHVRDQAATLAEFARVLRPGGKIAMVEPGPHHSTTAQSQDEMRRYNVIENDVSMPEIAKYAAAAGLDEPQMFVQMQQSIRLPLAEFNEWARGGIGSRRGRSVLEALAGQLVNSQCFSISKGLPRADSRDRNHLRARLSLRRIERAGDPAALQFRITIAVKNTGTAVWRTGEGEAAGTVKLGLQTVAPDGEMINRDFLRVNLPPGGLDPGEQIEVSALVPLPAADSGFLRIDVVSEGVAWFGHIRKCEPVDLKFGDLLAL